MVGGLVAAVLLEVRHTWQVTAFTARFIILGILIAASIQTHRGDEGVLDAVLTFGDILMQQRKPLIYGLVLAGTVRAIAAPPVQHQLATLLALGFLGYALYRSHNNPPDMDGLSKKESLFFLPLYTVGIVASLASIAASSVLLNSIAAICMLGIIFWRI
ncbi:MAG: hypothetical protein SVU32_06260 [Candidatus Nanohaloarchaea archaeon]|nr:hypothetical protein [Candidatus Nanohaloarchaea archaeon]